MKEEDKTVKFGEQEISGDSLQNTLLTEVLSLKTQVTVQEKTIETLEKKIDENNKNQTQGKKGNTFMMLAVFVVLLFLQYSNSSSLQANNSQTNELVHLIIEAVIPPQK